MTKEEFLYEYDLATIYMLINQHNEQQYKNKLVGRVFLSDESFEEFERNLREAKQENDNIESNSEYKEVRAVEFYSKCYRYFIALFIFKERRMIRCQN